MPRASWPGFLRLSLVSCPIYLSPAASRTKPIRLRQVWQPGLADEGDLSPEAARAKQVTEPSLPDLGGHDGGCHADQRQPVTRVTIRPHDPRTGEEIDKAEVVKGYEYGRGQFVTFTPKSRKLGNASRNLAGISSPFAGVLPNLSRVVVAIDPAVTSGDEAARMAHGARSVMAMAGF